MNKNQLILIFFFAAIIILASFWFTEETSATYYVLSTLVSTNLLQDVSAAPTSIDSFVYNLSAKPSGTTATIGFNQDGGSTWYDVAGNVGTETLVTGTNQTIYLTSGWSGANFYYKLTFTSDGTNTAVLDDVTLHYTIAGRPATRAFGRPLSHREETEEEQLEAILEKIIKTLQQLIQIYTQLIQMLKETETQNLNLLNSHASPEAGEEWTVSFETTGNADLTITPQDQDTVNDLDFVSLTCDGEEKTESLQIIEWDTISYTNWQCQGQGELIHLVNIAREHTLEFQFGDNIAYAYNNPDSVTDTFTDTSKIATTSNMTVNTTLGQIYSSTCKDNGTACSGAGECCSGYCVDGVCCDSACSGSTCQTCGQYSSNGIGSCGYVNDSGQDPDNECGTTGCYTGNCSASGYACGYQTSGQDLYSYCGTTGCLTGNCIGGSNACGYYTSGEHNCTTACTTCNGAISGDCVDVTDNTQDTEGSYTCSVTCKKCSSGSCINQGTEDLFGQCSDSQCYTGNCDGAGACGYQTSGQDLYSYCGTTGCLTGNCIGGSNACGYYTSGEHNCTTACTTCNGAISGDCVDITGYNEDSEGSYTCSIACKGCSSGSCVDFNANTEDSVGSNKCDRNSGTCYKCDGTQCTHQASDQDLWGECPGAFGTCAAATCKGSDYSCGYLSGQQGCVTCEYCTGDQYTCSNADTSCGSGQYGCATKLTELSCCTDSNCAYAHCVSGSCVTTSCSCIGGDTSCGFCPE